MSVRYNKMNITFTERVIVKNVFPRNMIINFGCILDDNHIPWDDIFDYCPLKECNIYIISLEKPGLRLIKCFLCTTPLSEISIAI